jgi:hypothetical protein
MNKKNDVMSIWTKVAGVIIATAAVTGLVWTNLAEPRILKIMEPTKNALEMQSFILNKIATPAQLDAAKKEYFATKMVGGEYNKMMKK